MVLFVPKLLGLAAALADKGLGQAAGGSLGLIGALSPVGAVGADRTVTMLTQNDVVLDILLGRDSGWNRQNRAEIDVPLALAVKRSTRHLVTGAVISVWRHGIARHFLWMLPISLGLLLSAPLRGQQVQRGLAARRSRPSLIPEESAALRSVASEPPSAEPARVA